MHLCNLSFGEQETEGSWDFLADKITHKTGVCIAPFENLTSEVCNCHIQDAIGLFSLFLLVGEVSHGPQSL